MPGVKDEDAKQTPGQMPGLRVRVSLSHGREVAFVSLACFMSGNSSDRVCRSARGRQSTDCSSNQQPEQG